MNDICPMHDVRYVFNDDNDNGNGRGTHMVRRFFIDNYMLIVLRDGVAEKEFFLMPYSWELRIARLFWAEDGNGIIAVDSEDTSAVLAGSVSMGINDLKKAIELTKQA